MTPPLSTLTASIFCVSEAAAVFDACGDAGEDAGGGVSDAAVVSDAAAFSEARAVESPRRRAEGVNDSEAARTRTQAARRTAEHAVRQTARQARKHAVRQTEG